ncbi:pteridine reductase [Acidithiobacillus montserratensis]|uniref:Pteridine reductase n=1 Tax=Acidithiobacillus montserratensis TaxID=2729135 RepID=A0ACD5HFM8_9PROT|nr:pteridine reductase [Acidithiobacillus montserratensis]MBN2679022.1 pteridine reductase [Acidithiobacillaceae bacterium]MBU2747411.1 pteridine reductase [Acidithiobacillus montserratensis]
MKASEKVVLITGAARRVGAAIARHLAARGCHLVLHYRRSRTEAEALAAALREQYGRECLLVEGDLTDASFPAELIAAGLAHFGRLDGLVNNASIYQAAPFAQITLEDWQHMEAIHLRAPLFLTQAAVPHLRQSQGAVVNIGDIHGEIPLRSYLPYSVSKAGLLALTRSLAKELGPEIRVNSVSPGVVLWAENQDPPDGDKQALLERNALKRVGDPQDIAAAVAYLLFDAHYTTGHNLVVDGGRMLY